MPSHSLLMSLRIPELAVIGWCVVTAAVSIVRPLPARRRLMVQFGAALLALAALSCGALPGDGVGEAIRNIVPALFVLGSYWVAGAFFVAPQPALERRLLAIDQRVLAPLGLLDAPNARRRWAHDVLEAAYLSVYALLPLGAWSAWAHGGTPAVDRYWALVFLAEASCYLALAWLQTRPPRALETAGAQAGRPSLVRRANEVILRHGSIHVNTLPSGHAAGAVSIALALYWVGSPQAAIFGLVAVVICAATVVGRYHFLVDSVAGAAVAVLWWWVLHVWWP